MSPWSVKSSSSLGSITSSISEKNRLQQKKKIFKSISPSQIQKVWLRPRYRKLSLYLRSHMSICTEIYQFCYNFSNSGTIRTSVEETKFVKFAPKPTMFVWITRLTPWCRKSCMLLRCYGVSGVRCQSWIDNNTIYCSFRNITILK